MSNAWQPPGTVPGSSSEPRLPPPDVARDAPAPTVAPSTGYQSWPGQQRPVTDQQPQSGAVVAIAWILAVLTVGYMLPWAVAVSRGKSNHGAIALVNVLTGWTLIGWIVSLVMACQAHQTVYPGQTVVVAQQFVQTPAGWYPAPDGVGRRYWDGQAWTQHRAD